MLGTLALAFWFFLPLEMDAAQTANNLPRPPCDGPVHPAFPLVDALPNVEFWKSQALGADWVSFTCTGWDGGGAVLLLGLAGRFTSRRDTDAMLARIGAISDLRNIRYWSVTDRSWNSLFTEATALTAVDPLAIREDFSPSEIRSRMPLYFLATENRVNDRTISRLTLKDIAPDHIVLEITNATPVRWYWFVLMPAHTMRTLYFLDRQADGSWLFYSLARADASSLLSRFVSRASYVNRAVAMYRHLAEIPTDRAPPAAP